MLVQDPVVDLPMQVDLGRPHPLTRTSYTSCGHRSWHIKCWHVGRLCQIIYKWQYREKDQCRVCSKGCPTCPLAPDKEQALLDLEALDLGDQTTIDHMEWLDQICLPRDPPVCPLACRDSLPMDLQNHGLKGPW